MCTALKFATHRSDRLLVARQWLTFTERMLSAQPKDFFDTTIAITR
jgi:hypothetical protein